MAKNLPRLGAIVAQTLATSWRDQIKEFAGSAEELAAVAPLLLDAGAGALAWRRIKNSPLSRSGAGPELQQTQRLYTLTAAINESEIQQVISLLSSAGVDSLLVKGWAAARLYPEAGLRPYGDIDLVVHPERFATALKLLEQLSTTTPVDLHSGVKTLSSTKLSEIYERSELVSLNRDAVRIPCPEDHLQMLCLHFLRHGASRSLSLCDIAVALESRPEQFDWSRCLGPDERQAKWVASAIELAVVLLEARPDGIPASARMKKLPRWFVPTVLKQWGIPVARTTSRQPPMKAYLGHPLGFLRAVRLRWPNPIEATVGIAGPFNNAPRLPLQIASCTVRTLRFLTGIN